MPTDTEHSPAREQARAHSTTRGRRQPATEPGEIPGQLDMLAALDNQDQEDNTDGQA